MKISSWFTDAQGLLDEKRCLGFVFLIGSLIQSFLFHDVTMFIAMSSFGAGLLGLAVAADQGK